MSITHYHSKYSCCLMPLGTVLNVTIKHKPNTSQEMCQLSVQYYICILYTIQCLYADMSDTLRKYMYKLYIQNCYKKQYPTKILRLLDATDPEEY